MSRQAKVRFELLARLFPIQHHDAAATAQAIEACEREIKRTVAQAYLDPDAHVMMVKFTSTDEGEAAEHCRKLQAMPSVNAVVCSYESDDQGEIERGSFHWPTREYFADRRSVPSEPDAQQKEQADEAH